MELVIPPNTIVIRDEFRALFDRATRSALRGHARIRAGIANLAETRYRVGLIYTHVQRCPKHVSRSVFDDRIRSGLSFFQRESGPRTYQLKRNNAEWSHIMSFGRIASNGGI